MSAKRQSEQQWTFLTNHAHVLISVAADAEVRVRDLALRVGITERAVHRILSELEEAKYIARKREGRRTRYRVDEKRPLRHAIESHCRVSELIKLARR